MKKTKIIILISVIAAAAVIAALVIVFININARKSQIDAYKGGTYTKVFRDVTVEVPSSFGLTDENDSVGGYLEDKYGNQAFIWMQEIDMDSPRSNYNVVAKAKETISGAFGVSLSSDYDKQLWKGETSNFDDSVEVIYYDEYYGGIDWECRGVIIPICGEYAYVYIYGCPKDTEINRFEDDIRFIWDNTIIPYNAADDSKAIELDTLSYGKKSYMLSDNVTSFEIELKYCYSEDKYNMFTYIDSDTYEKSYMAAAYIQMADKDSEIEYSVIANVNGEQFYMYTHGSFFVMKDGDSYFSLLGEEHMPEWFNDIQAGFISNFVETEDYMSEIYDFVKDYANSI